MKRVNYKIDAVCSKENGCNEAHGHQSAFQSAVCAAVPATLAGCNDLAKPHDGVGQTGGVAKDDVEAPTDEQTDDQ